MKRSKTRAQMQKFIRSAYAILSTPIAILFLTYSCRVHPSYNMSYFKRILLGFRFVWNHQHVESATSWRAHLVMAMKLLEMPPEREGAVVECGCWKGVATVNLSLVCRITGRKLMVYDSFEGLPPPVEGDRVAERAFKKGFVPGVLLGTLEEVKNNVAKYGAIEVCSFHPGWFDKTLPEHQESIALMFLDVDFCASLHDCLQNLWPWLVGSGMLFLDEYTDISYCAVFYSEKYWDRYFSCAPPGLIGIGTGIQVGMFFLDPSMRDQVVQIQGPPRSTTYCIKGSRALWDFYPDEERPAVA